MPVINVQLEEQTDGSFNLTLPATIPARNKTPAGLAAELSSYLLESELGFEVDSGKLILNYAGSVYEVALSVRA
jgi:hypothetical protein